MGLSYVFSLYFARLCDECGQNLVLLRQCVYGTRRGVFFLLPLRRSPFLTGATLRVASFCAVSDAGRVGATPCAIKFSREWRALINIESCRYPRLFGFPLTKR